MGWKQGPASHPGSAAEPALAGFILPDQEQGLAFHPAEFWGGMVAQETTGEMFISQGKSAASNSLCSFSVTDFKSRPGPLGALTSFHAKADFAKEFFL